ncbi:MAG: phytoene/squalene synthase family protein [Nakamurella sp.]
MSADHELDAAGITDDRLRADYRHCRGLAQEHGRSYFLATRFLPAERRPAVHALYGFARTADDIVDDPTPGVTAAAKTQGLQALTAQLHDPSNATDPSVRAALDAANRFQLDPQLFEDFVGSMQMDLTVTSYDTFDDLKTYVHGSAAVIGLMVLPILGTVVPMREAAPYAADLGVAFQLTNFIRDVGEDLRLGRIYLPLESLRMFGIDRAHLEKEVVDEPVRRLLKYEISRTRGIYGRAEPGIAMLAPGARGCVRAAFQLYGDILTAVEDADYQVFGPRIRVSRARRAQIAAGTMSGAATAGVRRRFGRRPAIQV